MINGNLTSGIHRLLCCAQLSMSFVRKSPVTSSRSLVTCHNTMQPANRNIGWCTQDSRIAAAANKTATVPSGAHSCYHDARQNARQCSMHHDRTDRALLLSALTALSVRCEQIRRDNGVNTEWRKSLTGYRSVSNRK